MASTIKVDKLEGSTGSTITVPTGQTLTLTDGLGIASLPTVTVAKGGTNLTSFTAGDVLYATGSTTLAKLAKGTAEQVLAMNSGATAPDWGSVDLTVLPTITVAKGGTNIASFTAGDILYATGSTTLAKLAKGTTLQHLRMNAGATAPEWTAAPSAGGAWNFISKTDISDDTTILVEGLDSTYETYMFVFMNVNNSTGGGNWYLRVKSGGAVVTASDYKYSSHGWHSGGSAASYVDANAAFIKLNNNGNNTATTHTQNHILYMYNPASTTSWTHTESGGSYVNEDSTLFRHMNAGVYEQTAAVTGLQLTQSAGGTFTTGNICLYGLAIS